MIDPRKLTLALFDFAARRAAPLRFALDSVFGWIESELPDLPEFLAAGGLHTLTTDQLQLAVDGVFAFIEGRLVPAHPLITSVLQGANLVIDQAGLPALEAWLRSHGLLVD